MLAMELNDLLQPPIIFCAGILMLAVVAVRMRLAARRADEARRSNAGTSGASPHVPSLREVREVAQQLNDLLAELQDTSRRIAAQIDNRYAKLDALLAEADARIRRLEQLSSAPHPDATPAPRDSAPPPPAVVIDAKYQPIYILADQGKTPREIAQELGTPPGEVELILNLRPKPSQKG